MFKLKLDLWSFILFNLVRDFKHLAIKPFQLLPQIIKIRKPHCFQKLILNSVNLISQVIENFLIVLLYRIKCGMSYIKLRNCLIQFFNRTVLFLNYYSLVTLHLIFNIPQLRKQVIGRET